MPEDALLLEPLAALSFGCSALVLELELDAPPDAVGGVLGCALEELEELSRLDASIDSEVEPDGAAGVVVEPEDDEDAEPAGGVVRDTARSPSRSQPAISPAPSARETATARVDSFM